MKKSALFAGFLVCLFVVSSTFAAGPTPIPASTKKPALTFVISKSGSYYLAGNRLCDSNGIRVEANDVTIDLRGFSLTGNNNGSGIYMRNRINVEISNGTISDFNYAINDAYTYMAPQNSSANHRVIGIRALSNTQGGIKLYGPNSEVRDCTVNNNGTSASGNNILGISVGDNSTVTGNTVSDTGDLAQSNASVCGISSSNNCIITGNAVNSNGYNAAAGTTVYGITANYGSTITGNTVNGNGYSAGSVYGIAANGGGSTVTGNTVSNNGAYATVIAYGIYAYSGCTMTGNTAFLNGQGSVTVDGIYASSGCSVIGNTVYSNGTFASGTVYGIYLAGHDFVNQNTAYSNNGTNMNDPGNCTFGQNHAPI
jgi:parallel beta-helix repeat protein